MPCWARLARASWSEAMADLYNCLNGPTYYMTETRNGWNHVPLQTGDMAKSGSQTARLPDIRR